MKNMKYLCASSSYISLGSTYMILVTISSLFQEVLVRFAGFGSEEDEWVNVRKNIRPRSLPCESSECVAVLPGDLILCFQVGIFIARHQVKNIDRVLTICTSFTFHKFFSISSLFSISFY